MESPPSHSAELSIGFLRRGYSPSGGAEAYLQRLAAGLLEQGHRVLLLGTGDWPANDWPGGEVISLPSKPLARYAAAAFDFRTRGGCDLLFSLERVPGCDLFRAGDGVHASWLHRRLSLLSPWKRVLQWYETRHREILALERKLYDPALSTRVIANSEMVASEICAGFSYPRERISIVRNGVPLFVPPDSPACLKARLELGIPEEQFVALFVGTGWERKGLSAAIRAVESADDTLLLVAGKGPSGQRRYRSRSVRFMGPVSDLRPLFAAADCFILPTLYDPFSNASLEALAAGLPVITSAANGISEILLEGVDGSVVKDPLDSKGFASALRFWRSASSAGRALRHEHASRYGMERNIGETLEIIREVISKRAATS